MLSVASLLGSLQELNQMGPLNFRGTEVIYLPRCPSEWASQNTTRAEVRQEDRLNLSILLSRGKETNMDSLSNGE